MNDNLQELLGETLNDTLKRNIKGVWNYLTTEKGLNPRNAAAIMGNVWLESRFLPDRVSSAGATGYMLFLGLREKDYQLWLKNNKHHPEYGLFDYILYAILDPEHKHDFYRNDYERVKKGMDLFKKLGKTKEYNEYNKYKNSVYGSREREGRLHFFSEVNDAFNNPDYKLDDLTTLWHDSIERSNPNEARLDNRKTAANSFLKYFYKPQASYDNLINPFQELLNHKYSTKPLFKKGGKAFVNGVNVLDSNPKAYKYVKKKYKMLNKGGLISKAQNGKILRTLQQELANRLNVSNNSGRFLGAILRMGGNDVSEDKLNEATINNSAKRALRDSKNYYNSLDYKERLKRNNLSLVNSGLLSKLLDTANVYPINSDIADKLAGNGKTFRALTKLKPAVIDGKSYSPGIYYNKGTMHNGLGEGVYGTMVHEYSHWGDRSLTPDARKHNHSLIEGNLNEKADPYYKSDTEIRARAMDVLMNYMNNKDKYKSLKDFTGKESYMKALRELKHTFKDELSMHNYLNNFVKADTESPNDILDQIFYSKNGNKLISKAQEGTKFQNLIGNVSNFLKSDSGLSIINGVGLLFKTFKSSSDLEKQREELNKWKRAYVNSITPEDASLQVEQEEVLAKQANPDYNSSPVYKAWRLNQLELDSIQAAKQKAAQQADMYILNKLLEQLELNNESLKSGMEDLFNKGLGMLSLYIGNKNNAPSVVTPIKDYAKDFKQKANFSVNDMNFKVAMATKDPTYRLPNYTLPSLDYKFSWQK